LTLDALREREGRKRSGLSYQRELLDQGLIGKGEKILASTEEVPKRGKSHRCRKKKPVVQPVGYRKAP